jgi:uncharacterized protein
VSYDPPQTANLRADRHPMDSLFESLAALEAGKKRPPVTTWRPERIGTIDIRIAVDGTWYHEGAPIRREALVRLFASVLRRDPDGYCLVTPAEKLLIRVDDAPFVAVDMEVQGEGRERGLLFVTNVGDAVVADAAHPIRVADTADGPRPYVRVRDALEALVSRPVYYRLVECAVDEGGELAVYSRGARFVLGSS